MVDHFQQFEFVDTCQINDTHQYLRDAWNWLPIGNKAWFNYSVFNMIIAQFAERVGRVKFYSLQQTVLRNFNVISCSLFELFAELRFLAICCTHLHSVVDDIKWWTHAYNNMYHDNCWHKIYAGNIHTLHGQFLISPTYPQCLLVKQKRRLGQEKF